MDDPSIVWRVLEISSGVYREECFPPIFAKIGTRKGPRKDLVEE